MLHQPPLCPKVGRELDGATEACPYHGWADAAIKALYSFVTVYLRQAIKGVFVVMLCAHGKEGGEGL